MGFNLTKAASGLAPASAVRRTGWGSLTTLVAVALTGAASAQAPGPWPNGGAGPPTVSWTAVAQNAGGKPGGRVLLTLQGVVKDGWHVYGLKQQAGGPTPLRVTLDPNDLAIADGPAAGSRPTVAHDPAFGLDTPYYSRAFTLTVPVRLKRGVAAGRQSIPVSVRFQTCNGQICEPPKTIRLTTPLDVKAG